MLKSYLGYTNQSVFISEIQAALGTKPKKGISVECIQQNLKPLKTLRSVRINQNGNLET